MLLFNLLLLTSLVITTKADYKIGVGIADCTGPATEITFMGYAQLGQIGCGIHLRQFSRAFIFDDGKKRVVFVSVDAAMIPHGLRQEVLNRLNDTTYTEHNVVLSGTHTHGGPGGFMMDVMYDFPDLGFVPQTFEALVSGITRSITNAHENIVEGKVYLTSGELLEANLNRSPAAYEFNPEEERNKYDYDTDKEMVQLKLVRSSDNKLIGAINWFAVHGTSMNNTNCLISSDNVGYAALLLEESINEEHLPGKGEFVGAFASSNLGDVTPNIKGPICIDTGNPCDYDTSTCDGSSQNCIAFGPGDDMFESTQIIAERLFEKGQELLAAEDAVEITGDINFIHQYVSMPNETVTVELENGTVVEGHGCIPAMGYSFAAGTIDGPGLFDFTQADLTENPFWNAIRDFVFPPTPEEEACHYPKPILINSGVATYPYQWQPVIVSTQLLKIGDFVIAAVPGEFTTMSGRRTREAVQETIINNGGSDSIKVVLAGLCNTYTSYIATRQEYEMQRYEGASTIYGPYTLEIYLKKYKELAQALSTGEQLDAGPTPEDFSSKLIGLTPPIMFDMPGTDHFFGDCILQPPSEVTIGDTVTVQFVSGNPRNEIMQGGTFLSVEKLISEDSWETVANDANWETKFTWKRTNYLLGESQVTVEWHVESRVEPGTYRIQHFGNYKLLSGETLSYHGSTDSFQVQK